MENSKYNRDELRAKVSEKSADLDARIQALTAEIEKNKNIIEELNEKLRRTFDNMKQYNIDFPEDDN